MSIPKDGKVYAAWHYELGFVTVAWNIEAFTFHHANYPALDPYAQYKERDIIRWMDENGQWHEVTE